MLLLLGSENTQCNLRVPGTDQLCDLGLPLRRKQLRTVREKRHRSQYQGNPTGGLVHVLTQSIFDAPLQDFHPLLGGDMLLKGTPERSEAGVGPAKHG